MKELSIEEKAKRYDEVIKQLRTMMPNWESLSYNGKTFLQDLVHIIPELKENKESEDEQIRKRLIQALHGDVLNFAETVKAVAWLEKQGEQNLTLPKWKYKKDNAPLLRDSIILNKYGCVAKSPSGALVSDVWVIDYDELAKLPKEEYEKPVFEMKTPEESLGIESDTYSKIVDECIYGEQKPADVRTTGYWHVEDVEQKPAWSEEDEENLNWFEKFFRPESLITKCKDVPQDKYLWFKSLKDRVQPKQEWRG